MYGRRGTPPPGSPGGFQLTDPPPKDVAILLVVVFVTFSLRYLSTATAVVPALLELSPAVWTQGFLWQVVTYPFIGSGAPGLWLVIELLILYFFARDTFRIAGRRGFWQLILVSGIGAGLVAVGVALASGFATGTISPLTFELMQGQRLLLAVFITAFSVAFRHATILLFFVIPVRAGWFLWITPLFAFLGFLSSRDLPGFLGICAAVALTYGQLVEGGMARVLRRLRLRWSERQVSRELDRIRRASGLRLVDDDEPKERRDAAGDRTGGTTGNGKGSSRDPWVH